jgi:hypothetical protein
MSRCDVWAEDKIHNILFLCLLVREDAAFNHLLVVGFAYHILAARGELGSSYVFAKQ